MTSTPPITTPASSSQPVAIIGGGLAGMSAAAALCQHGVPVVLYEARRRTGGRAGSFFDAPSGTDVDYCQHVAMGCCTNLLALLQRTGLLDAWQRHDQLRFLDPEGRTTLFAADPLPAPLHLARSLLSARFLCLRDRIAVARGLVRLMRFRSATDVSWDSFQQWLEANQQPLAAQRRFWQPIVESALGESADKVDAGAARKVFVDGFAAHRDAFHLYIPDQPLSQLFGDALPAWLQRHGVDVRCGCPVTALHSTSDSIAVTAAGRTQQHCHAILAVPWHQLDRIGGRDLGLAATQRAAIENFPASSIAGIHLWLDAPLTRLQHVVFVDRFCQWLFSGGRTSPRLDGNATEHYYQVVISSAANVQRMPRDDVARRVREELRQAFPDTASARLLRYRIVNDPQAVFSLSPAVQRQRPQTGTTEPRLFLAGDYTDTGWPATMEGAVISGARAAEAVLAAHGRPSHCEAPPLARGWLARRLIRP